jgi:hypothetical protein
MINIVEDGMEFVMKEGPYEDGACSSCPAKDMCKEPYLVHAICNIAETHHCISAAPVQEETKVYHLGNRRDASRLRRTTVDYWDCGWVSGGELVRIDVDDICENPFQILVGDITGDYAIIREPVARRLTQAQIIEAHPDLEGVGLVGGWK